MSSILKVDTIQDQNGNLIISKDSGGSGFLSPYASSSAAITYTVTVASKTTAHPYYGVGSSNGYFINGIESPIIEIKGNDTSKPYHYKFDQSDSSNSGHPLLFYNNVGKTTQFTTGVTTNGTPGSSGAYTMIAVDSQTPNILYYQCSSHANMGNHTFATSPVVNTGVFLTLPTADGSSGQFVTTNGSGVLSFASVAAAAITSTANGADNRVATYSDADSLNGEASLTFNGTTLGVDGAATFNESSADVDFRVESNSNDHMFFVDGGNNRVGVANTPDLGVGLHIKSADSGASVDSNADELVIEGSGSSGLSILSGTNSSGNVTFGDSGDANVGRLEYNHGDNSIRLDAAGSQVLMVTSASRVGTGSSSGTLVLEGGSSYPGGEITLAGGVAGSNPGTIIFSTDDGSDTDPAERMRILAGGGVVIAKTSETVDNVGHEFRTNGIAIHTRNSDTVLLINRLGSDGTLQEFEADGNLEGTISVSGNTVSYNGFTGTHWSRFIDNSTPTILRGTVLESLDEMCDWYQLHFTDSKGNTHKISHKLLDSQSVGDVITYLYDTGLKTPPTEDEEGNIIPGGEAITENVQATIVKEDDVKHMMSKISDTTNAKNVYGVFVDYDNDGEGYNDFYVASVGSFVVRIKSGETVAKGDLLQSNGDGTAKVQSDDNVKSSSFAKVLSTTKIETYEDGSFIVPCSLMC